jgi:hypothetical protein
MEHPLDRPIPREDFDYEKEMLKSVFDAVLYESANAIDENLDGNSHTTEMGKPFFTATWVDSRGYNCHLRAHHLIRDETILKKPGDWKLKVNYYFSFEMIDQEPRQFLYSGATPNRIVPTDDVIGGLGSEARGEHLQNADYVFGCEILQALRERPTKATLSPRDVLQFHLYALDMILETEEVQLAIKDIDLYGRHASRAAIDKAIAIVLELEPELDVYLVRRRIEDMSLPDEPAA